MNLSRITGRAVRMNMLRFAKIITVCVMATGLASASYAQGSRNKAVMPEVGAFDNLSSRNKKIAEVLFNG